KALSVTLTIAVLVSLLLALSIIPLLAEQWLTAGDVAAEVEETRELEQGVHVTTGPGFFNRLAEAFDSMSHRYERSLGRLLRHTRVTIVVALLLVVGGVVVHRFVGTGFLPEMDEGAFVLDYWSPGGTALTETDRMLHIVERILGKTPEITGTSRRTGAELGLFATEQNRGDLVVRLKSERDRDRSSFEIIDEVRGKIEQAVPRLRIEFVQILTDVVNDLAGNPRPVEVKIFGPDLQVLEAYAKSVEPDLSKVGGLEDLYN